MLQAEDSNTCAGLRANAITCMSLCSSAACCCIVQQV